MYINAYTSKTNLKVVKNIQLLEENSELNDEENILKSGKIVPPVYADGSSTITPVWDTKQYSIDEFYGCALFVGTANITNLDKETIFTSDIESHNKGYILSEDGSNQFKVCDLETSDNF